VLTPLNTSVPLLAVEIEPDAPLMIPESVAMPGTATVSAPCSKMSLAADTPFARPSVVEAPRVIDPVPAADDAASVNCPLGSVVPPEYVLETPKTSVPPPAAVRRPDPEITPPSVARPRFATVVFPESAMALVAEIPFARASVVPVFVVMVPVPAEEELVSVTCPLDMVVPPV
jgi:hypothetical protein